MTFVSHSSRLLKSLNSIRWYLRWPVKWAIFGLAYALVCFPYPHLAIRHLRHWSDPNAIIEPDAPSLQPLVSELRSALPPDLPPPEVLKQVEKFVYRKVPYDWDWNTWGMADYLPSVEEIMTMGKEDCDGRAVIAASLLRNLGHDARLVTDFAHVWVSTPDGETMGPGKTKTVEITDKGLKVNYRGILQMPRILGYGISVFPLGRELILVGVLWLLLLGSAGTRKSLICLVLMIVGLLMLRHGATTYRGPVPILEPIGAFLILSAAAFLGISSANRARTSKYSQIAAEYNSGNAM